MSSIRPTVRTRVALASPRRRGRQPALHRIGVAAILVLTGAPAWTLPTGANTVAGQVSVTNQGPNAQTINQGSQKAIIDWKSFSIGAGERVNVIQPSAQATLLNRVIGYDPSRILGQLQANGRVFLVNPYGIVFGAGARIDVGGLVASTLDIGNTDFMAGRFSLTANGQNDAAIVNEGAITTRGGTVVLLAPQVTNSGTIEANGGRIGLAAANNALVDIDGDGLVFLSVDGNQATNRLNQVGRLQADAGSIELRAAARAAMSDSVLNLEGVVQARSMGLRNGRVVIDGGDSGVTHVNGMVDVSGRAAGERGGEARVLGYNVMLDNAAVIDAAGSAGGGMVLVGGNWQGQGPERNADQTIMRGKASIDASATNMGDGGTVVLWANDRTQFHGTIRATGGASGGDGGKVETSGEHVLRALGTVRVGAPFGKGGQWLLDPNNITIKDNAGVDKRIGNDPNFDSSDDNAILDIANLAAALDDGATVRVLTQSKAGNSEAGDIFVAGAITTSLGNGQSAALSLLAQRNIEFQAGGSIATTKGTLNLTLSGGTDSTGANAGTGTSQLIMPSGTTINTNGGGLTIVVKDAVQLGTVKSLDTTITSKSNGAVTQTNTLTIGGNLTIAAGTGNVTLEDTSNTIAGNLGVTGGAVSVKTSGAMNVTAMTATGNLSLVAGGALTLPVATNLGTAGKTLTLSSGTTLTTTGTLTGSNIALTGTGGLNLDHNVTATGTLSLTSTNSPIIQAAGKTILATGGATTVNAGNSTVTLNQATNDFLSIGINTAGTATVQDANAVQLNTTSLTNLTLTAAGAVTQNGKIEATGTVSIATAVTENVTLEDSTNNFATFAVTAGKDVSVKDAGGIVLGATTATGTLTVNAVAGAITTSGAVSGTDVSLTGATGITLSQNVTATGTLGLATTNTALNQTAGKVVATGVTTVAAGTGDVTLAQTTNDFSKIAVTGGAVSLQDTNALEVTALTAGANKSVSVVAGAALTLPASAIDTGTGDLTLTAGTTLTTPGNLSGKNLALTGTTGLTLANDVTATGALGLTTTNSLIDQTAGKVTATGATTVAAGTGNVTLAQATNNFGTLVLTSGKDVSVTDAGGIDLGAMTASGTLTVNALAGTITTSGAVSGTDVSLTGATGITLSQNVTATGTLGLATTNTALNQTAGKVVATGVTTVAAGTGDVTLAQTTNDFSKIAVTGGAVSLQDTNALEVTALTAGANKSVSVVAGAALTLPASAIDTGTGDLTLTAGTTLTTPGNLSGKNLALTGTTGLTLASDVTATGALGLTTTNSLIDQTAGKVTATGATTVAAGTGNVTLAQATNNFGTLVLTSGKDVSVTDAGGIDLGAMTASGTLTVNALAGTITTSGAVSGTDVSLTGATGITLSQNVTATGTLGLATTNTALNQTAGKVVATGVTTVATGTGDVTLAQTTNDFSKIAVTGGAVSLQDTNALEVTALTAGANKSVSVVAGAALTLPASAIDTGTGDLTLTAGTTLTTPGNLSGKNLALTGTTGLTLANDVTATGALGLTTTNSLIDQTAGKVTATGATTVAAGTGNVTLAQATNNFGTLVLTSGKDVSVTDAGGIDLGAMTASGTLTVNAVAGAITTSGAVSGTDVSLTGATGITLSQNVTATGALGLTTTNSLIDQTAGKVTATGATTVAAGTGNVTLAQATNNFGTLVLTSGKDVSVTDAGGIDLGAMTASGTLTVNAVAGAITTSGAVSGTDVSLTGATGITLSQNVTATGTLGLATTNTALNQTAGKVVATGVTTVAAGTGDVTLAQTTNDFSKIAVTGGAVSLQDTNALEVTALTAGANKSVSVVAGAALTLPASAIDTGTGDLTLTAGTTLTTPGNLSGKNLALTGTTGLTLANDVTATGALGLTTTNSLIDQTAGKVTATGATTVAAGTGNVTLAQATNNFGTLVLTSGKDVSVTDAGGIDLGAMTASGTLTVNAVAGAITTSGAVSGTDVSLTGATGITLSQNVTATGTLGLATTNTALNQTAGKVVATGVTTVAAGTGDVTLAQTTNDFSKIAVTGGAVSLQDTNALEVTALTAGADKSVSVVAGAALTLPASAIDTGAGDLTLSSGTTLTTPGNLSGTNLSLTGATGLTLANDVTAGGTLKLNTTNSLIDQTAGKITATGVTTAAAGTGNVSLAQANDFSTVSITGAAISVQDANALTVSALTSGADKAVSLIAVGALTLPAADIDTGTASLTLSTGATLTTAGKLSGAALSLTGTSGISLGHNVTATDTFTLTTTDSAVTQAAGSITAATTTVTAGKGDVKLAGANDFTGAVTLSSGAVSIVDANDLKITSISTLNNQDLSVVAGGALTFPSGDVNTGTGAITLSTGTALTTGGTLTGGNISLTGKTGLTIQNNITASGTLALTSTNADILQTNPAVITVGGATTVNAGSGKVTLFQPGNDFSSIAVTGGTVLLQDANKLELGAISANTLTIQTDGALTQSAPMVIATTLDATTGAGNITLNESKNDFQGDVVVSGGAISIVAANKLAITSLTSKADQAVTLTATSGQLSHNVDLSTGAAPLVLTSGTTYGTGGKLAGTNVSITAPGGISISQDINSAGTLGLTTTNADVTQSGGAITVTGVTTVAAGTGKVDLSQPNNDFATIAVTGSTVTLRDTNEVTLGSINATNSLTLRSGGKISQSAAATVTGTATFDSGGSDANITHTDNKIGTFVATTSGAASITNKQALALGAISVGSLTVDTSGANGAVTQSAPASVNGATQVTAGSGNIALTQPTNDFASVAATGGAVAVTDANGLVLGTTSASSLAVIVSAALTQSGTLTISGATTITAGGASVTLPDPFNDFNSIGVTGAGAVTVADKNALVLGSSSVGSLTLATGGAVTQDAAVTVGGAATIDAGSAAITLSEPNNDFGSVTVKTTGGAVSLRDKNSLTVTSLVSGPNQNVTVVAGNALSMPLGSINTGTGNLTLTAGDALTTFGDLTGKNVTITGNDGLTIGDNLTATGTLSLNTTNFALTQTAGTLSAAGGANVNAGSGAIKLDQPTNNFGSLVISGGSIALRDANDLTITSLTSGANQAVSIIAGGSLALPAGAIDTGTASLTLNAGTSITTGGTLSGADITLNGSGGLSLGHAITTSGNLSLTTTNSAINQTAGVITVPGLATVNAGSGNVTLTQAGNDFGSVTLTGGAISVVDTNGLTVNSVTNGANQAVNLQAGNSMTLLQAGTLDTGSADLTLTATGGLLSLNGGLAGAAITLTGGTGIGLGGNVTSTGTQTYAGNVLATKDTVLDAAAAKIDLQGSYDGGGTALTLNSSSAAGDAIRSVGGVSNVSNLSVNGNLTLNNSVTTSGTQTYANPVILGGNATLSGSDLTFNKTIDGAQDLAISVTGVATLKGNVGGTTPLTTFAISGTGSALIGLDPNQTTVKTTGDQNYQVPVTLAGDLLVVGDDLVFAKLLNTKIFVFETQSTTVQFLGGVTGTGTFVLAPNADQTIGIAGASGTFQVSQAQLDGLKDYATIIIGRSDTTTKDIGSNSVTLPSNLRVRSTSGNVTFNGTIDSAIGVGDKNLQVDTSGLVTFNDAIGSVGALGNVTVNTKSAINAPSIIASGSQSFTGAATIGADTLIQGASISFGNSLATGTKAVQLFGDAISITGPVSGTGSVQLAPITASTPIGIAGGAGVLQISQATLDAFGSLKQLTIGQAGGTGAITSGTVTLSTDTVIQSKSGDVSFTGQVESAVGGAKDLTVNTTGQTSFGGSVGATRVLDVLSVSGDAQSAGGTLASSGAQTFGGNLTLTGDTVLRTSAFTVNGALATGVNQVDIQAGSMAFNGSVTGTGNLLLAPDTTNGSIGLSGGAGGLQISQATLDKFDSYNRVTIGRTDGTGTLTAGNLSMPAHLTLRSSSGAMQLTGTVNDNVLGSQDLVVSTTGTTTLGAAVGAVTAPRSLAISGPAAVDGGVVTTTGTQTYGSTVTLGADATLSGSAVSVTGVLGRGANDLAVFADSITLGANSTGTGTVQLAPTAAGVSVGIAGGSGALQLSQALLNAFAASSSITVGRSNGVGTITAGALELPTDMVVQGTSSAITLTGTVDSAASGARDLALNTSGLTTLSGSLGATRALDTLNISGAAQFGGGSIVSSGTQAFGGNLTLTGATVMRASGVTFSQDLAAGANALDIQAGSMAFIGAVSGTGSLLLAPDTVNGSIGLAGAAGGLQISQATLNKFASFDLVTIGRADGTGTLTANALTVPVDLTLRSGSGAMNLTAAVNGASAGAQDLTLNSTGTATFSGSVGGAAALRSLSVTGPAAINGGLVNTTGAQAYGSTVSLGAATTLSGASVAITGALANGANSLLVQADSISMGAASSGSGTVQLTPSTGAGGIGLAGGAGTLQISQALLDAFASSSLLSIGRTDGTGAITAAAIVLPTAMVVQSDTGTVTFGASIDSKAGGARDLAVNTTGLTTLSGAVGASQPIGVLAISGASKLAAGSVTTTGSQTYTSAVTLGADNTLAASAITFGSTVDGANALTLNAAGKTTFGAAVGTGTALTSLTTDAAGSTLIGGNVSTTAAQIFGDAITLNADSTLSASAVTLGGTVNGNKALVLAAADATVSAAVGNTTALTAFTANGRSSLNGGAITTTGAQTFTGATTLGADTALSASAVTFGATLDGKQALAIAISSKGDTAFNGTVGGTSELNSLAVSGGGTTTLAGEGVTTTGAQSYSAALTVGGGNATFTASALTFGGNVSGAKDLTLKTDALTATGIAGSGVLTIAPQDKSVSIGLAGAAGAMQISQATIDSAAGFTAHAFGRADGTGAIQSNDLTLRANTTLQTNTGNMRMNGKVDGAFDLVLNSGGQTRIAGPLGSVTALKSLTTDNNAGAADFDGKSGEQTVFDLADNTGRARVITSGAQTFNDPLNASVPMQFIGGAVKAVQASSSFAGTVVASADSLALTSGQAITLGDVTLANGGAIQTGGLLDLSGALTLNGGSLVLTSTATPTALAQFTDAELKSRGSLAFGTLPVKEASATVFQSGTGVITTAVGSTLALRSPAGGTISLINAGNQLAGGISAVSGKLNDTSLDRFNLGPEILLGEVRIVSSQINVAGAPPASNDQTVVNAGLEADFMRLSADRLATGTDGQIRVRLPYNSAQGTRTSVPGVTFEMSAEALKTFGNFGNNTPETWIQVSAGGTAGGFLTVVPKGAGALPGATILLGGQPFPVPFYDGTGKLDQIRVFFNGATTQTAQETGALQAVTAVVEDSRQTRFEEAVRTENVTARLRSGVIAEVGAGRPATVGRETIRLPQTCDVRPGQLKCE